MSLEDNIYKNMIIMQPSYTVDNWITLITQAKIDNQPNYKHNYDELSRNNNAIFSYAIKTNAPMHSIHNNANSKHF
ncbi:hypothetical protein VCSRO192_3348 [Vibrio cholerae]|nr:hypothetical protein VCSRO192_3348 [Vibrio cholerae]